MPFFLLYVISDFVRFILCDIARYRRIIITQNLQRCFPEKDAKWIRRELRRFYRNLSDVMVETFKGFYMSERQLRRRWRVVNPEVLDAYFVQKRDVMLLASHYANWEWGILSLNPQLRHQAVSLYMPMTNRFAEEWSRKRRSRLGMRMVSVLDSRSFFSEKHTEPLAVVMAADQCPSNVDMAIVVPFMGIETACLHGVEAHARRADTALVYLDVRRERRGHYTLRLEPLLDHPAQTSFGELTALYMSRVEKSIRRHPSDYLWSHRRWKHTPEQVAAMKEKNRLRREAETVGRK